MKHFAKIALLAVLLGTPLSAQDTQEPDKKPTERLMDFFDWLSNDGEAFIEDFMSELGPQLEALRDHVQDWTQYEAPEVLENGDIIIRRKPEAEIDPEAEPEPLPEGTREI